MRAIEPCRTAALSGHVDKCDHCQFTRISYNYCRNRHCPKCQGKQRSDWLAQRKTELLPVEYFHVVFTTPAQVAAIAYQNKTVVYDRLPAPQPRPEHDTRRQRVFPPDSLIPCHWAFNGFVTMDSSPKPITATNWPCAADCSPPIPEAAPPPARAPTIESAHRCPVCRSHTLRRVEILPPQTRVDSS